MTALRERLPVLLLVALFTGYAATYFHRADLPTLAPLLATDVARADLHAAMPDIASAGMLLYALGKVLGGWLADRFGGRRLFVFALGNAAAMELLAASQTAPLPFALCRMWGMVVLGCAWPSLGHVVATVTPRARLGGVLAWLSQSYLLGDASVRVALAAVVSGGGDAVAVLRTSVLGLAVAAVLVGLVLLGRRGSPIANRGANANAVGDRPAGVPQLLVALALMNAALSGVREALSLWSPRLLVDLAGLPVDDAVRASALLPLASCAAVLGLCPLADRSPRALFLVTFGPACLGSVVLVGLACGAFASGFVVGALAVTGACLAVPMVLASGVLPLRAGSTTGGALRLGLVDGAGSLGGVLAGSVFGRLAAIGPATLFAALAGLAVCAAAFAVVVTRAQRVPPPAVPPRR